MAVKFKTFCLNYRGANIAPLIPPDFKLINKLFRRCSCVLFCRIKLSKFSFENIKKYTSLQ